MAKTISVFLAVVKYSKPVEHYIVNELTLMNAMAA